MAKKYLKYPAWDEARVRRWVTAHNGILTKVAIECDVSVGFVNHVAYGKSGALPGHHVETVLKKYGWPGIQRRK
jgi:hypothetical protein